MTTKEKLFCTYYIHCRDPVEAAQKSGYSFPAKRGYSLLERNDIAQYIQQLEEQRFYDRLEVEAGYRRLAFGCIGDAVSLLFKENLTEEDIARMNLFNVSEIKRPKGGGLEIKFFDRLKALDKLESCCRNSGDGADKLFKIIGQSAERMMKDSGT